ncbi:MAG TPA: tripartite tricarboxylate transporter TctB family protein [Chloroflexota bacterium]|nr:tripartite tricarboxylate transporter TctB family protein [Chloroflexota bacterium]
MKDQQLTRGLVLIAIALGFGIPASGYQVGTFSRAGPGLFPLLISGIVGLIGLVMIVRSRLEKKPVPMTFKVKNILIVLAALVGFVVIAEHFKVALAVVYLVFVASLAGSDYSIRRNLKICVVLFAFAYAFHTFLGLSLTLF